ncbi:HipA domain-containing protein [Chitinophaga pinensis]|uniref:HipA domain protein n=1 Tax=Chitinophaga pinensis (strain ATCC 43595 / DSM 2588 / LMG 13176 / NBRC 15968 / NCIMB 11800 / UQM 2034) TaxID=485918 RepID=A0A979FYV8_CHIPD|nr:HipA domain-containing protein [Chitinophaga pinensis]ACU57655.1 HipA domain protein [Chitinophaga pinensis DSM 2588]
MPNCLFCYKDAGDQEYHSHCAILFFNMDVLPELKTDKQLLKELAEKTVDMHVAVTGVQPKLTVTLADTNIPITVGLWSDYILKPQHDVLAGVPETEDLTMHLAAIFGIAVCKHTLLRSSDGTLVYVAKRFDRVKGEKLHMEDFCQLSELPTESKYKGSYERAGKLILKYSTTSGSDVRNYFQRLVFCFLTGNNDMHLKNFSLLHLENDIILSPAYDLLNVNLVFPKDQEETALLLNGKKKNIKRRDFEALGTILNIPEKIRSDVYRTFTSHNTAVYDLINASFLSVKAKVSYWEIWSKKQQIFEE